MVQEEVKARKVGDSIVITLSKSILAEINISIGESLLLETMPKDRVLLRKSTDLHSPVRETEMELEILLAKRVALKAEINTALWGINNDAPTEDFPWVNDQTVVDGAMRNYTWMQAKIDLEIAQTQLTLYNLGIDGQAAVMRTISGVQDVNDFLREFTLEELLRRKVLSTAGDKYLLRSQSVDPLISLMKEFGKTKLECPSRKWHLTSNGEFKNPSSTEIKSGHVTLLSNPGNVFNQQNRFINPYFVPKSTNPVALPTATI